MPLKTLGLIGPRAVGEKVKDGSWFSSKLHLIFVMDFCLDTWILVDIFYHWLPNTTVFFLAYNICVWVYSIQVDEIKPEKKVKINTS
jgi:hypothetical protein